MKKLILLLAIAAASGAHAGTPQCTADSLRPIATLNDLPGDVQLLLGRGNGGVGGIADAHEEFNATDALGVGPLRPMSRFRQAYMDEGCAVVIIERGGIAHFFETVVFRKEKLAWRKLGARPPSDEEMQKPAPQGPAQ